ncbi:MAG: hypothetical protein J0H11_13595 [Rhizobiales bacterium]|nr:hypothetical protein [Hyphomicrobiales bacterium]
MANLFATAGAKLYIGGVLNYPGSDLEAAAFSGQSWTEIKRVSNLGSSGDSAELVTFTEVGCDPGQLPRIRKVKGATNAGSMTVIAGLDYADAGQIALVAASRSDDTYAFRLVFDDAPAGGTPSERLFTALVMSATEELNEANTVVTLNTTLEIDSNIVRISAAIAGSAPDNTVLPAITGTAEEGETLTVSSGTWTGSPTPAYGYQWFRDGESIPGATTAAHLVVSADVGKKLRAQVTATNINGTGSAFSAETATVTT